MRENVLVVGNNVRNVVESAFKAGYSVYALTKFLDLDVLLFCNRAFRIESDEKRWVSRRVEELVDRLDARVVLTSGFEDLPLKRGIEILGCDPNAIRDVVDKRKFYKKLDSAGLPYPEILSKAEGRCILKPVKGGGGEDIRILDNSKTKEEVENKGFIIQRLVDGFPCSASVLAGKDIHVIALNEILAGWGKMNARDFRYCGNLTPLVADEELRKNLISLAEDVCSLFDLKGSVGVDFVVERSSMKAYILEINPRFQGSLDSIEWSTDLNVFELHMKALKGEVVKDKINYRRFAIRAIFFATDVVRINQELSGNPFFADIPTKGTVYQKEDPVVSILASEDSKEKVVNKALSRKDLFLKLQSKV